MKFGIIGTGYVAQFYAIAACEMAGSQIVCATDIDVDRAARFTRMFNLRCHRTVTELFNDPEISAVIILTEPSSHAQLTRAALLAGKHVYCEKPLALDLATARELIDQASSAELIVASAPCNVLGSVAERVHCCLNRGVIGQPLLAYANLDDGAVYRMRYQNWVRAYGAPWPARHEFTLGCVIEHAAYQVSLLSRFFGPATELVACSSTLVPNKWAGERCGGIDFALSGLRFANGAFARLTCSVIAPRDRSLTIVGEEGVIEIDNVWDDYSPVYVQRVRTASEEAPHEYLGERRALPPLADASFQHSDDKSHRMNFALGLAELARAVAERGTCRLGGAFTLHVLEIVLGINQANDATSYQREITTSFCPSELWPEK